MLFVFTIVFLLHVIAAISVGPILLLPFLVRTPAVLVAVKFLRFGAVGTLLTGIILWILLRAPHPAWLVLSAALYVALCVVIAAVVEPAAQRVAEKPEIRFRLLSASIASSALTLCIVALMVLRPGEA